MRINQRVWQEPIFNRALYCIVFRFFLLSYLAPIAFAGEGPTDDATWKTLTEQVDADRRRLNDLIEKAEASNLNTDYASVSQTVLKLFTNFAAWDRAHPEELKAAFKQRFGEVAEENPQAYLKVPFDELAACREVANNAIAELQLQLDSQVRLQAPPDFSKGRMALSNGAYRLDGKIVFPSKFTWMPATTELMQSFGYLGGTYYNPNLLNEDLTIQSAFLKDSIEAVRREAELNRAPLQVMLGHSPPDWLKRSHPEVIEGERWFVQYDIHHPKITECLEAVMNQFLPEVKRAAQGQPLIQVIANEPHWVFGKGNIWIRPGGMKDLDFSDLARDRYAMWLRNKYGDIETLNSVHGTNHTSFDDARQAFYAPMETRKLQGTALWYDLCRFNMDRANEWFEFLKQRTQEHAPESSPVSIKLLGHYCETSDRDTGIDLEYLVKLQDVMGSDNQLVPLNAERIRREYKGWMNHYMLDWREQSITLDFAKSICPDKPFYDSEWHGASAGEWVAHKLDRGYMRTALWLAYSHGLNVMNAWVWGRDEDGAMHPKASPINEILTMPTALDSFGRTMKELNAHAQTIHDLVPKTRYYVIYYCEEAAIQDHAYAGQMADVYEALKLQNISVGFTTPTEIEKLDVAKQTLIVPPTRFISDRGLGALKTFDEKGGNWIVVTGNDQEFSSNEFGQQRTGKFGPEAKAKVAFTEILELTETLENALAFAKPTLPVDIQITDTNGVKAYGVFASQTLEPGQSGSAVLLINISQQERVVSLSRSDGSEGRFCNLLTGQPAEQTNTLAPYDILLLWTECDR